MAGTVQPMAAMGLEEFLRLPEMKPYLEYLDGRVEAKMSPSYDHSSIQKKLVNSLDAHAEPLRLGVAMQELRCNFAGRSVVPDVIFVLKNCIPRGRDGRPLKHHDRAPDLIVEIVSEDQPAGRPGERVSFAVANGSALGWLIDPDRRTIDVYRPDAEPVRLADDGVLEGEPVLPGYRLAASEVFGWLDLAI